MNQKKQILFIHQNFPGQYRYLAKYFAEHSQWDVFAIGERSCVQRQFPLIPKNITVFGYDQPDIDKSDMPNNAEYTVEQIVRAEALTKVLLRQKNQGLKPDIILAHPGWGEGLYLKEIFPQAKLIYFFEFFFKSDLETINFDPEFTRGLGKQISSRINSATALLSLHVADAGVSPTRWQWSTYPEEYQGKINVIHDGVDTSVVKPSQAKSVTFKNTSQGEVTLKTTDEIISYSVRNLEPSRGFHQFMRALPGLQSQRPNAIFVIVGGDDQSYSGKHSSGLTWREVMLKEVGDSLDMSRTIFVGKIPYQHLLDLFSLTDLHLYWTTPFVLSWSLMEAMACEATILASSTEPVKEVIKDDDNGCLFDFFDEESLLLKVEALMNDPARRKALGKQARQSIIENYDLQKVCLPKHLALIDEVLES